MAAKLPKFETYLYFVIWFSSFTFAFIKVYLDGESLSFDNGRSKYFNAGWKIFNRKRDISDSEFELWADYFINLSPWIVFHLCVSELTRLIYVEAMPICYLLTTMSVLIFHFPLVVSAFFILELSLFFLVMLTNSKKLIWTLGIIWLVFVNNHLKSLQVNNLMDENQINFIYVSNGWFFIRCLDFVLSESTEKINLSLQFLNYLAYIFYLPCFFLGPFIPYDHFKYQLSAPLKKSFKQRISTLMPSVFIYIFYFIMYEVAQHFLYCNAMHFEIKKYLPMGMWTVSGVGICLANFFYLKYVIVYGFSSAIANAENYRIPPHPKCIYRIHLYSNMWRHFDRGFYLFLFRCIYAPICGRRGPPISRRMYASLLCFIFVYIWHGGTITVFYWSIFNYIGLISESICKYMWNRSYFIQIYLVKKLSIANLRRLQAFAASPLWLLAVISNFIFFGGHEMGFLFISQLLKGSPLFYVTLVTIAYSMCQVSIETAYMNEKFKAG